MSVDTAKAYLKQVFHLQAEINRLNNLLGELRASMYSVKSPSGTMSPDKVQTSMSGDALPALIAKMDEMERRIIAATDKKIDLMDEIAGEIEGLTNEKHKDVLFYRYIRLWKWDHIAMQMGISDIRYIYRIHGSALIQFDHLITSKKYDKVVS